MPRILVVANLTLGGEHLLEAVSERVARGPARLHVLVPASDDPDTWHAHDEPSNRAAARERLDAAMAAFEGVGAKEVTGEIGSLRPLDAIGDTLRREADDPFDEIVLSTLPPGPSRWLRMDLPSRVARAYDVPMTHVVAAE